MKTYPLLPSEFAALRTKLLSLGVTLPSDSEGVLSYKGIELHYEYDGIASLKLIGLKKPTFVPWGMIWEQVDKWITEG